MKTIGRRVFVKQGALALLAMGLPPEFLLRPLLAGTGRGEGRRKTLICIFQRGAVDGLSMVVPFAEPAYYRVRRSIQIAQPRRGADDTALDLDGRFGLHPALEPLLDLYRRSEMAVVHAAGSPHPTRSHFDAQDFMETATPGVKSTGDGWLNRVLQDTSCPDCSGRTLDDPAAHAADHAVGQVAMASVPALRGIAMGSALPRSLAGAHPALAIPDLEALGVAGGDPMEQAFQRLYRGEGGDEVTSAADDAFEALRILRGTDPARYEPANGAEYPRSDFGRSLRQIAQLIKADVGVEIAFADLGGWDTHVGQGGARGQLANRLGELARGIRALYDDLGDRMEDVVILTMSEFGRTVAENGSGGTDHGHANCMFALGGGVRGGAVLGDWPGLEPEQLYEGRDLAVTTDFRDVFAEVVSGHLGAKHLERVFPGYTIDRERWRGVLR
ncbi:MAG: DUF1501 domain-containing protein [Gemmatimonadetes bacterium]|nr:MAG: DUF1501 domain-containing protein [Gemmatimonadota bacterium]